MPHNLPVKDGEMVSKLISAVISSFRLRLRQASQTGFHRSSTTFQFFWPPSSSRSIRPSFLSENLGGRHERVLEPSRGKIIEL
ncbi:MAG: hypothetical protein WC621_02910 [Patescibacteria group bacterium]